MKRSIHELLTILRDNAEVKDNKILYGLCNEAKVICRNGVISYEELIKLKEYISKEKPGYSVLYGWPRGIWPPRLTWLNEHIELTRRPKERARNCPNCGELHWDTELNYSSTKRIDCDNGSFVSTLYGVCRKCAERHEA